MTINLDELRKTVENAGEAWSDGEHIDIITPPTVLALIAEIESLRTRFKGMRASRDSERSRADKNAHKLEQAELLVRVNNQEMIQQAQRAGQAEQDRVKLLNRLDAMRRQRDGYRNQLRKTEQQVARVREMHERIPVLVNDRWEIDHCKFCYEQDFSSDDAVWPCPTIRTLDGDGRG